MAFFKVLIALAGITLVLVNGQALQPLTTTLAGSTATEGTETTIPIVCSLDTADAVDTVCPIALDGGTTDAEYGYDIPDISTYSCTITAGALSGTVSIPYFDDANAEPSETLSLICTGGSATPLAITLVDDDTGAGIMASATFTQGSYVFDEADPATTATLTIEYVDNNGNKVNAEEDLTSPFSFNYPNAATSDTAILSTDFTLGATTAIPTTSTLGTDGSAFTGLEIEFIISSDANLENLKQLAIQLTGAGTFMASSTEQSVVMIRDDDMPGIYAINDCSPIARRSKKDVSIITFTKGTNTGFQMSSVPYTPKDMTANTHSVAGSYNGMEYVLARPSRRSRTRFNDFTLATTETIGTPTTSDYTLSTHTFISATSHSANRAPIELSFGPTVTVYPSLVDCTDNALSGREHILAPYASSFSRQLRWFFYSANDPTTQIRLAKYNGKSSFYINTCSEVGTYMVCRKDRCDRGWVDFIRVIQAVCPIGTQEPDPRDGTCADPASATCTNGGIFDPYLRVCICPAGFAGVTCEIALTPGQFGSSAEFSISSFSASNRGRCVVFCYPDPGGCSCAAGFYGNDCCKECPSGTFGADCAQTCNCVDDLCDPYSGVCANGCASGFSGTNCQS